LLTELETGLGLDIVLDLQAGSNILFDTLAWILNIAGSDLFYLATLLLVYWTINRRLGLRLLFALVVAGLITVALKALLQRPRPFMVSDEVVPLFAAGGFGIPSGHVLIATVLWGYLADKLQRRWGYALVGIYILFMMWSRMYAGVHFPQDVVAGLVVGWLVLWLYAAFAGRIEAGWQQLAAPTRAITLVLAGIGAAVFLADEPGGVALAGIMIGLGPALEIQARYAAFRAESTARQRILRYLIGLALTIPVLFGLRFLFIPVADGETVALRALRYALTVLVAVSAWPWLMLKTGLAAPAGD